MKGLPSRRSIFGFILVQLIVVPLAIVLWERIQCDSWVGRDFCWKRMVSEAPISSSVIDGNALPDYDDPRLRAWLLGVFMNPRETPGSREQAFLCLVNLNASYPGKLDNEQAIVALGTRVLSYFAEYPAKEEARDFELRPSLQLARGKIRNWINDEIFTNERVSDDEVLRVLQLIYASPDIPARLGGLKERLRRGIANIEAREHVDERSEVWRRRARAILQMIESPAPEQQRPVPGEES